MAGLVGWATLLPDVHPAGAGPAPVTLAPLEGFEAADLPNDSGGAVALTWRAAPHDVAGVRYLIFFAERPDGPFRRIAEIPATFHFATDVKGPWWAVRKSRAVHLYAVRSGGELRLADGQPAYFRLAVTDGTRVVEGPVREATPRGNLFNWAKLNNLGLMVLFTIAILYFVAQARRRPEMFLRRIPGLDAVEEAIGRATEMGRPVLYLTGSDDMSSLSTIAASVILGEVARRTSAYGTDLVVPHRDPIVMAVCQEVTREAYLATGRPDAYKEDSNFFITSDQFSYTAAVDGIMLRERPAANFFMGYYYAESLLLAETGASTGAIQIAGTDSDAQLPFFITACDYTLIGEELYAASAYLSRERVMLGTLRGQDLGKAVVLVVMVVGTLLATLGALLGTGLFEGVLDLFRDFR